MSHWELLILSVGLAMDAFAVSICKGLSMGERNGKKAIIIGLYFGGFQAGMPLLGYFLGTRFQKFIANVDHWIAFVLLVVIGLGMLKEALEEKRKEKTEVSFPSPKENDSSGGKVDVKTMLPLAVATSIDALMVGVTFAMLSVSILPAVTVIGVVTFIISVAGVEIGRKFGGKYRVGADIVGGCILILIGCKVLLTHLLG